LKEWEKSCNFSIIKTMFMYSDVYLTNHWFLLADCQWFLASFSFYLSPFLNQHPAWQRPNRNRLGKFASPLFEHRCNMLGASVSISLEWITPHYLCRATGQKSFFSILSWGVVMIMIGSERFCMKVKVQYYVPISCRSFFRYPSHHDN